MEAIRAGLEWGCWCPVVCIVYCLNTLLAVDVVQTPILKNWQSIFKMAISNTCLKNKEQICCYFHYSLYIRVLGASERTEHRGPAQMDLYFYFLLHFSFSLLLLSNFPLLKDIPHIPHSFNVFRIHLHLDCVMSRHSNHTNFQYCVLNPQLATNTQ